MRNLEELSGKMKLLQDSEAKIEQAIQKFDDMVLNVGGVAASQPECPAARFDISSDTREHCQLVNYPWRRDQWAHDKWAQQWTQDSVQASGG